MSGVLSDRSYDELNTLHPKLRQSCKAALIACNGRSITGFGTVQIDHGERTFKDQDVLYALGRTSPGKIVTMAKGGQSWHNYCLAFDIVITDDKNKAIWDTNNSIWSLIANIFKSHNFEWGGDFRDIKDYPHFQNRIGIADTKEALELYEKGILHSWRGII